MKRWYGWENKNKKEEWQIKTIIMRQKEIGVRWINKTKKNVNGEIEKYKVRWLRVTRNNKTSMMTHICF